MAVCHFHMSDLVLQDRVGTESDPLALAPLAPVPWRTPKSRRVLDVPKGPPQGGGGANAEGTSPERVTSCAFPTGAPRHRRAYAAEGSPHLGPPARAAVGGVLGEGPEKAAGASVVAPRSNALTARRTTISELIMREQIYEAVKRIGIICQCWNDAEKISMAPVQG